MMFNQAMETVLKVHELHECTLLKYFCFLILLIIKTKQFVLIRVIRGHLR